MGKHVMEPNSLMVNRNRAGEPFKSVSDDVVAGASNPLSRFQAFRPRLEILSPSQRALWPTLRLLAGMGFVLYDGTAIALRLGHRESSDFDFFTERQFDHQSLMAALPFASAASVLQAAPNTLTLSVTLPDHPDHPVKVSFFGGLTMGRIGMPTRTEDGVILAASLPDLLATKLKVMHQRIEKRDYLDIHGLLSVGCSLPDAIAGASALFGKAFQPRVTLTAMTYFEVGNLGELPPEVRKELIRAAVAVESVPPDPSVSPVLGVAP
jgi:hypothetical protein